MSAVIDVVQFLEVASDVLQVLVLLREFGRIRAGAECGQGPRSRGRRASASWHVSF